MAAAAALTRLTRRLSDERAANLAKEAIELSKAGESEVSTPANSPQQNH
jgi:hypothetical protein